MEPNFMILMETAKLTEAKWLISARNLHNTNRCATKNNTVRTGGMIAKMWRQFSRLFSKRKLLD
jgi:hypothetical protein